MQDQSVQAIENSAPAVEAQSALTGQVAEQVKVETSWRDALSEDLKDNKILEKYNSLDELAKSNIHAQSLIGKRIQDLKNEDIQSYLHLLGRPESVDKYVFPDEIGDAGKGIKELAFKLGLNQEQAKGIADEIIMKNRSNQELAKSEQDKQLKEWHDQLHQEFGNAFDKRIAVAQRAVNELGGNDLKTLLNDTGLGDHPIMVKLFEKIGKEFLEEGKVVMGDKESRFGTTPHEASLEINRYKNDKEFTDAYFNINHPRHKDAVLKWEALHKQAYVN